MKLSRTCVRAFCACIVLASVGLLAPPAHAATVTVSPGGDIQDAIDNADPGDTVKLGAGRYDAAVLFNSTRTGMTLTGPCKGKPAIIDAYNVASETAVTVEATDVSVNCVTMRHGINGLVAVADDLTLKKVTALHHGSNNVKISGNDFSITKSTFIDAQSANVYLNGDNGTVEGNLSRNSGGSCWQIYNAQGFTFRNNRSIVCDSDVLDGADNSNSGFLVENNYGYGTRSEGIELNGDDHDVKNNRMENIQSGAFDIEGNNAEITGNVGIGSDDDECFILDGDDLFVSKNTSDNCEGGFDVDGDGPVVLDNRVPNAGDNDAFNITCEGNCGNGRVEQNYGAGVNADDEGFQISVGVGLGAGFQIRDNTAVNNAEEGFVLDVNEAIVTGNVAKTNGGSDSDDGRGFDINGDTNTVSNNKAISNADDGFRINGDFNDVTSNIAQKNTVDGIHVGDGRLGNELDGNTASGNHGEGIENDGIATELRDNVSKDNRHDCAGDEPALVDTGNACADGTDFTTPSDGVID